MLTDQTTNNPTNTNFAENAVVVTKLKTKADSPKQGIDLFVFGDADGSWLSLVKQFNARGILTNLNEAAITNLSKQEANLKQYLSENNVKYDSRYIPDSLEAFNPSVNGIESFISQLKFQQTPSGQKLDIILIGDLLQDRHGNDWAMIRFLNKLSQETNLVIIHSNHDFKAIELFASLRTYLKNYCHKYGQIYNPQAVKEIIFNNLHSKMNDVVKDFSAMQANNIFLGGVYFGYSSVTWYYTLQHLVATQKSIQPIIEFINSLDQGYYPSLQLVHSRLLSKTGKETKVPTVYTHAPTRFSIVPTSRNAMFMAQKFSDICTSLGGSAFKIDPNEPERAIAKYINAASIINLYSTIDGMLNLTLQNPCYEHVKASHTTIKVTYREAMRRYGNIVEKDEPTKQDHCGEVEAVFSVITCINRLLDIYKNIGHIESLLSSSSIVAFLNGRTLFDKPYGDHISLVHGHIGVSKSGNYNDGYSNATNVDHNGVNTNPNVAGAGVYKIGEFTLSDDQTDILLSPVQNRRSVIKERPTPGVYAPPKSRDAVRNVSMYSSTSASSSSAIRTKTNNDSRELGPKYIIKKLPTKRNSEALNGDNNENVSNSKKPCV